MHKTVIIVAGGTGTRMGSDIPKQFMLLGKRPLLMHSIQAFYNYDNTISIILVLPEDKFDQWGTLCKKYNLNIVHQLVAGGETRFNSVKNGLDRADESSLVAIHDGARPLIKPDLIKKCFKYALKNGNAVPVVEPADSIRIIQENKNTSINRKFLKIVQTPQVFHTEIIKKAFEQKYSDNFTDEANVAESFGEIIRLIKGNQENIKITRPEDLIYAEALMKK